MHSHPTELWFGHGGAGILLSGPTVKEFNVAKQGMANRWDHRIVNMTWGDYVLAAALDEEMGLKIQSADPMMHVHHPALIPWSGAKEWCQAIITLHHMDEKLQKQMQDLETSHPGQTIRFRELYHFMGFDKLEKPQEPRRNWDNWAGDLPYAVQPLNYSMASTSVDACEQACRELDDCLQFSWSIEEKSEGPPGKHCMLSRVFRYGQELKPATTKSGTRTWTSGWMPDRIAAYVANQPLCEIWAVPWPHIPPPEPKHDPK